MATQIRNTHPLVPTFVDAINAIKTQIGASTKFHLDKSELTAIAATASDLTTAMTLCNELIAVWRFHAADTLAHKAADATELPALNAAVDLDSAVTAAEALRVNHGDHIASTTYHYNADATNTISATTVTDLTTLKAALNEMKTDLNAHMADGPSAASMRMSPA